MKNHDATGPGRPQQAKIQWESPSEPGLHRLVECATSPGISRQAAPPGSATADIDRNLANHRSFPLVSPDDITSTP